MVIAGGVALWANRRHRARLKKEAAANRRHELKLRREREPAKQPAEQEKASDGQTT